MTTVFTDLIASTTESAVRALLQAAGELVDLDFEAMPDNSPLRSMVRSVVTKVIYDTFAGPVSEIAKGGFLDFAPDGPWLEALGEQFYDTERIRLTFATSTVTFENVEATQHSFVDGQVIVQNSTTKRTYRASAFSILEAGDPQDRHIVDVIVTAIEPGSGGSADAGDIDEIVTPYEGLTITGSTAAVGTDLESAAAYIARCRLAAAATSPGGAADAYEYVALSATDDDGVSLGVTRVNVDADNTSGEVTVYIADADGPVAGDVVTAVNDLFLEHVVPHGIDFQGTNSASAVNVSFTYSATALSSSGLTEDEIEEAVTEALDALLQSTPIGGWSGVLPISKIRGTIVQVEGLAGRPRPLVDVTVTLPAGNVALTASQVPVRSGTPTATITFLDDD